MTSKVLAAIAALAALGAAGCGVQGADETGKLRSELAAVKGELAAMKREVEALGDWVKRHEWELTPRVRPAEGLPGNQDDKATPPDGPGRAG